MDRLAGFCIDELIDCWLFFSFSEKKEFLTAVSPVAVVVGGSSCRRWWKARPGSRWCPSDNHVTSTFNFYPKSHQLPPSPLLPLVPASIISCLVIAAFFSLPLSPFYTQQPELFQSISQIPSLLCPKPSDHHHQS